MPTRLPNSSSCHTRPRHSCRRVFSTPLIEGHSPDTPSARVLKGSTHPLGLHAEGFYQPSSHSLGGGFLPNLRSSRIPQAYGRPPRPEGSRANHIDRRPHGSLRDVPGCSEAPLPGSARKSTRQGSEGRKQRAGNGTECGFLARIQARGEP